MNGWECFSGNNCKEWNWIANVISLSVIDCYVYEWVCVILCVCSLCCKYEDAANGVAAIVFIVVVALWVYFSTWLLSYEIHQPFVISNF